MNQTTIRWALRGFLSAGVLAIASSSAPARADQNDTVAEALFRAAQQLLADGKVHEACEKFAASERVQHAMGTKLNLAACHEKEGRLATAWSEYADANAEALRAGDSARATFAQRHHDELEPKLSRVAFRVADPADGEALSLDGIALPREGWTTPVPVDPGEHALKATAPGRRAYESKLVVPAAGATPVPVQTVSVPALASESASTVPSASGSSSSGDTPVVPPSSRSTRTLGLAIGIGGVVATGVGVGLLAAALSNASSRDSACTPGVPCPNQAAYNQASSAYNSAQTEQVAGFIIGGVGVAAIAAGAYFWFSSKRESEAPRVGLTPWFDGTRATITATGRF